MTEKTPVLGWMILWQRSDSIWRMAFAAVFFRLFLFHVNKGGMILVCWHMGRGFRRRIPEKEKDCHTDSSKDQVVDQDVFFLFFLFDHCLGFDEN